MNQIIQDRLHDINLLCSNHKVKELYAFGSVCTDNFNAQSDIDLLISFENISIEEYTENYFLLHHLFEELLKRPIDLVTERSLSNPYFIESVNKTKTLIYGPRN